MAASLVGQTVVAVLFFAVSVITARLLGPAGKGEFSAWTLGTLAGAVLLGGSVSVGAGRAYLSGEPDRVAPVAARHGLLVAAVVVPACGMAWLAGAPLIPLLFCIAIGVPLAAATNDLLLAMQAAKRPWSLYAVRVATALPVVGGLGVLVAVGVSDYRQALDLSFVFWGAGFVVAGALAILIAWRRFGYGGPASVREVARRGHGSYGGQLGDWIILRADRFIVVAIVGPSGLGVFSVAVNWAETCLFMGHAIGQAMFEDERTADHTDTRRVLVRSASLMAIVSAVIVSAAFFLIEPIFGSNFEEAKWATLLLGPGMVARTLGFTAGQMMFARGRGSEVTRITVATLVVAVPAWIAGAAVGGIEGAAAASTLVYGLQMVLSLRALKTP